MKACTKCLALIVAVCLFIEYSPTLLDINPEAYDIPFLPLTGPLEINDKLSKVEHLFEGSISGPESIVAHNGDLYTGTEDGRIIKIHKDKLITLAQTGRECCLPYEEKLCGRPLGMRIGSDGLLYVIDAYYGLHSVNVLTGFLTRLLSNNVLIDGRKIVFPDDIDIDDEGNVYMSDASKKWDLSFLYHIAIEHEGSGRIIKFNVHTGKSETLLENLYFPNGVQISHDKKSLLICEAISRRVLRYYLSGPKKGIREVLIDKLPAEPDNIRLSSSGGYWIALTFARNSTHSSLMDQLGPYPFVRRFLVRTLHAVGRGLTVLSDILNSHTLKEFAYRVRKGDFLLPLLPNHGIIIELDDKGNIIRSFQSPDGSTTALSQVTEHNGYLYLGSFINHYIGRLKL